MTQPRYVCIHGHFYQPPRENPWLEAIELQESADPFHDWNARITAECYRPNSAARIQSDDGHILGIINNYARMSFNFGPTLLSWMEKFSPETYQAILDADKESLTRFDGHGSAMAQVYNHIIMPLANERDQETQIVWGIRDFEHRFGRKPEGMWLAEAAVDTSTLEQLVKHDIKFTVLAPRQAKAMRPIADNGADVPDAGWDSVEDGSVDPARAYLCNLPSGKSITLFFYDGPISQAVAFEGILRSGETFAQRLASGFSGQRDYPQLLHIATDGETYGHHHKFGDMALAYALHYIEDAGLAKLTNYSQYMELHPPEWEVQIVERSSWSCAHGVRRWNFDCGCSSGMHHGWKQQWREPLREALDYLRDAVNAAFETKAADYFSDPWRARNGYIDVILDRNRESIDRFVKAYASRAFSEEELSTALQLMETQRQMMLMYTSCGWFFDELSGIETVQVMQYAARAIQLAESSLGVSLEKQFISRLREAKSNIPGNRDGEIIYDKYVKPSKVDLIRVGAHYAVTSLFRPKTAHDHIYAFSIQKQDWQLLETGLPRLAVGRALVVSDITLEKQKVTFGVLHLGDHNLTAGVRGTISDEAFADFSTKAGEAFKASDLPTVIRILDQQFFGLTFSLGSLFKDERQLILDEIISKNMEQAESALKHVFENNAALMRFLVTVGAPQPEVLRAVGKFVVGGDLNRLLLESMPEPQSISQIADDAAAWNLQLDAHGVELSVAYAIETQSQLLLDESTDVPAMRTLIAITEIANHVPFWVNFWQAQNVIFRLMSSRYLQKKRRAELGDAQAQEWVKLFHELSNRLKVEIDE